MKNIVASMPIKPQFRTLYSDGTVRPILRGCLHALVSCLLLTWCVYSFVMSRSYSWTLNLFVISKLPSYVSSAIYHLSPIYDPLQELILLKIDTLFISVAMWAPTNLFVSSFVEWKILFIFMLCATTLNAYIIHRQFTENQSPVPRVILLMIFGSSQMIIIGWHVNFSILWCTGTLLYLLSSCAAPPMYHHMPKSITPRWHHKGVYGWHEDFHFLLFTADVTYLCLSRYANVT